MSFDMKTIKALHAAGLVGPFELTSGFAPAMRFSLTPDQIGIYLVEGRDALLASLGYDPRQVEEWLNLGGVALCMGQKARGGHCSRQVGSQHNFDDWRRLHRNEYCTLHGGDKES